MSVILGNEEQITIEDKHFQIKITKEERDLYRLGERCSSNESAKDQLKVVAELYTFCNAYDVIRESHYAPKAIAITRSSA